jgi:hypothetical protein
MTSLRKNQLHTLIKQIARHMMAFLEIKSTDPSDFLENIS